jgi:hypothetical protein
MTYTHAARKTGFQTGEMFIELSFLILFASPTSRFQSGEYNIKLSTSNFLAPHKLVIPD